MDVKTLLKKVPLITEVEKVGNTFLVGGSIRDYILRRPLADFDIVIERDFDTIVRYLKGLSRKLVLLDEVFGEVRVILDRDTWLDVSSMRGKTIEDDLRGRDFTINAIALSTKGELIDPLGGINDLKRKLIRVPSSSVLREDPLRILRAFRFISTLNLELEDKTADYIRRFRKLINIPKPERLHYEFIKLLEGESVADTLWKMQELGVLLEVLAELKPMEHTSQRYYRERSSSPLRKEQNLLFHSLLTVEKLEMLLKNLKDTPFRKGSKQLSDILSDSMRGLFLLGALLHDIGKPETITKDTEGRTHFYGHDKLGERIVESMCKRLRFSNEETDTLKKIVRLHMYPHLLVREEEITPRALFRYRRKTNSLAFPLILLAYADASASPTEERGRKNYESLFFRLSEFIEEQEKKPRERLITGYDLIDLGMTPGPIFKEILEEIEELYVTGKITTKRQALKEVKSILRSLKDKNISS